MIKLRGRSDDGRPVIILGLSHRNLDLLRDGKPISFSLTELGLIGHMVICAGETEESLAKEIVGAAVDGGAAILPGDPPKEGLEPQ